MICERARTRTGDHNSRIGYRRLFCQLNYPPEFPGAIWQRRGLENLLCLSAFSAILPKDRPLLGLTLFFFS